MTLEGNEPSPNSRGNLKNDIDYICISYRTDIIDWIELCIREAYKKPILRETLRQYLNTINELTQQNPNNIMQDELVNLLTSNSINAKSMFQIFEAAKSSRLNLIQKFASSLKRRYDENPQEGFMITFSKDYGVADENLWLESPDYNHSINLYFAHDLWNPTIGIAEIHEKNYLDNELIQSLSNIKLGKNEKNWGNGWVWINRYDLLNDYFLSVDKWSEIADGNISVLENVLEVIYQLIDVIVKTEKENNK